MEEEGVIAGVTELELCRLSQIQWEQKKIESRSLSPRTLAPVWVESQRKDG